jgi:dihydroflavonol-4-reductase
VANELTEHRGSFHSHYERTKVLQEEAAFSWPGSVEVVCVNPSSVQGPGRATGTGELLLRAVGGTLPALPNVSISIVDIDDCARGHLLAAERGVAGERYLLNGFTVSSRRALELLGRVVGEKPSTAILPASVVRAAAKVARRVERVRRLPAPICAEALETIAFGHRYDGRRATLELGLEYTDAEETLRRFVEWAREEGHLR